MSKYTPGPWLLSEPEIFPFDLVVSDQQGDEVLVMRRIAHSTGQKNVADCVAAIGFPHAYRERVAASLEQQRANARLIAAAPELLEALTALCNHKGEYRDGSATALWADAYEAIAKATGGSHA